MQEQTQQTTEIQPKVLSAKELLDKLVPIYLEIDTLEGDAKALKDECNDEVDFAGVVAIAKAKVKGKLGKLEEKAQATLDMIEELI
jgi:hypothetical protein